jgi:hypothetical protein
LRIIIKLEPNAIPAAALVWFGLQPHTIKLYTLRELQGNRARLDGNILHRRIGESGDTRRRTASLEGLSNVDEIAITSAALQPMNPSSGTELLMQLNN